jgi:single-strand DNA-binding protein
MQKHSFHSQKNNMATLNKILLIGNVTRDPEMKFTPKGTPIANFGIAVNDNYKDEAGTKHEKVTFLDCTAFGKLADIIGQYVKKGKPLFLEGKLEIQTWDDKTSGQKRNKANIIVESMQMIGGNREDSGERQETPQRGRQQAPPTRQSVKYPDLDVTPDDVPF